MVLLLLNQNAHGTNLFDSEEILKVNLQGPLATLVKNKHGREEFDFTFSTSTEKHLVKVQARGNSRKRICQSPPLRINFSRKRVKDTLFHGQNKLKLVTQCDNTDASRSNLLEELAAYKIFNLISEVSFKTRLLEITYVDTSKARLQNKKGLNHTQYAFLIESESTLAQRLGGTPHKSRGISLDSLDDTQEARVYVFQYLIGNTDWSLVALKDDSCCHNANLIELNDSIYYVPYDFDLSGMVNASYAYPDPSLGIRHVKQRLFRGFCLSGDALPKAVQSINGLEEEIMSVNDSLESRTNVETKAMAKFLQGFFNRASDEEKLVRTLEKKCL